MAEELNPRQDNQQNSSAETKSKPSKFNWGKVRAAAAWFAFIESASLVLWQEAEDFSGAAAIAIHFASKCGMLLGGTVALHKVSKSKRSIWISFSFLCLAMAIVPLIKKPAESNRPAFFVKTFFANIGLGSQTSTFLLWEYHTRALIPINIQMLIQLGNLTPAGLKISSLQFEGKSKGGKWVVFPMIDRQFGDLGVHQGNYWGIQNPAENPDPAKTYFPEAIYRNPLLIEPITAYVLLEIPNGASADFLRLRISEASGQEYVENVSLNANTNRLQVLIRDNLPLPTYRPASNDISQVQVVPYSFILKKYGPTGY